MGLSGQDLVQSGTFWGFLNVSLRGGSQVTFMTHLEKVIIGEDQDSVSTLGGMTTRSKSRAIPRTIGAVARSPSSGVSVDQSYATMDSRVSQLEDKIGAMEVNITNSMNASMETMFKKFNLIILMLCGSFLIAQELTKEQQEEIKQKTLEEFAKIIFSNAMEAKRAF